MPIYVSTLADLESAIANPPADGLIYLSNDIAGSDTVNITDQNVTIESDPDAGQTFTINLRFQLTGGSLTLQNVTDDGQQQLPLQPGVLLNGGTFTLGPGSLLTNFGNISSPQLMYGGIFMNDGTLNINGGAITNCTSQLGGALLMAGGTLNFTCGEIGNNTAFDQGGGIFMAGGNFVLGPPDGTCACDSCPTTYTADACMPYNIPCSCSSCTPTCYACYIHDNYLYNGGGAGMILAAPGITGSINCTLFSYNFASSSGGGGLFIAPGVSTIPITNSAFTCNSAADYGGAISAMDTYMPFDIDNCLFYSNSSYSGAGAIAYLNSGQTSSDIPTSPITNSCFYQNSGPYPYTTFYENDAIQPCCISQFPTIFNGADMLPPMPLIPGAGKFASPNTVSPWVPNITSPYPSQLQWTIIFVPTTDQPDITITDDLSPFAYYNGMWPNLFVNGDGVPVTVSGDPDNPTFYSDTPVAAGQVISLTFNVDPNSIPFVLTTTPYPNTAVLNNSISANGTVNVAPPQGVTPQDTFTKTSTPSVYNLGDVITFTVTWMNVGAFDGTVPIRFEDQLAYQSISYLAGGPWELSTLPPGWTVSSDMPISNQPGTTMPDVTLYPILAPGEGYTFTYTALISPTGSDLCNRINYNNLLINSMTPGFSGNFYDMGGTLVPCGQSKTNSLDPDNPTVEPGDTYTYTLTVPNVNKYPPYIDGYSPGQVPVPFQVTDTLPAGLSYVPGSMSVTTDDGYGDGPMGDSYGNPMTGDNAPTVNLSQDGQTLTFSGPNVDSYGYPISYGVTIITFQVQVDNDAPGTVLQNTASLAYGDLLPTVPLTDPNPPTVLAPAFAPTKSGTLNLPADGNNGTVTWTVSATNSGQGTANPILISDTLQQGQVFNGQASATVDGSPRTVTQTDQGFLIDGSLEPGQSLSFTFQTTLPDIPNQALNVGPGTLITNTALLNGTPTNQATLTLPSPSFTTRKIASTFDPQPGDTIYYTITSTNTGDLAAIPYIVTDPLPSTTDESGQATPLMTYDGGPVTANLSNYTDPVPVTVSGSSTTPVFTVNQIVRPGETIAITFPVTLSPNAPLGTPLPNNQAYVQGYPNGPRTPVQEIQSITPTISSFSNPSKVSTPLNVTTPGSTITYNVVATNSGTTPTSQLMITDTLPDYLSYAGNLSLQVGGTTIPSSAYTLTTAGNNVQVTVTDSSYQVPPGATAQLNFDALLSPTVPLGTYVQNTALFQTGPNDMSGTTANSHLPFVGTPTFSNLSKIASRQLVAPGDSFTYSISTTNTGNAPADPFTVSDPLPPGLTYVPNTVTASLDGSPVAVLVSGDSANPVFTLQAPVQAQDTVTLSFTVTADPSVPLGTTLTNTATVTGYPYDPGTQTSTPIQIGTPSFTEVTKAADITTIYPGQAFNYTVTAANNTTNQLEPLTITDTLPDGLTPTGVVNLSFNGQIIPTTVAQNGQTLTITSSQPLPPGASATLTYQVQSAQSLTDRTRLINTAHLVDADGVDHPVSSLPITVTAPIFPGVTKTPSQPSAAIGDTFTYTITGTNAGGAPTIAPFIVTDTLPAGIIAGGSATATVNGQTVPVTVTGTNPITFSLNTVVPQNGNFSLTFPVTVTSDATHGLSLTNTATITSYPTDPGYPVNGAPIALGHPDFSGGTKIATDLNGNTIEGVPAATDGSLLYTITATNNGEGLAVGPFRVTDTLPEGVTIDPNYPVTATITIPGSGTFQVPMDVSTAASGTNQSLIFEHPLADTYLPAGSTVTFTYKVDLSPNAPMPLQNIALIHADPSDPGSPTSSSNVITGQADFSQGASKTSDPVNPVAGHPFTYTVTATNNGTAPAPGFLLTDPLPSPLTYNPHAGATATLDGQTVPVTVGGTATTPTFSVDTPIPVGATISVTFPVSTPYNAPTTVQNTATLQSSPNSQTASTSATTTLLPPAPATDALSKTSSPTHVFPGQALNYTINWQHQGSDPYQGLILTDLLPSYVSFPPGATAHVLLSTGIAMDLSNIGTAAVPVFQIPGPMAPGTTATIIFSPTLTTEAQTGVDLVNNIIMDNGNDLSYANDDGIHIESPNVTLTKTATPDSAHPGEPVTYTITATNNSALPLTDFAITDQLPGGLTLQRLQNLTAQIGGNPVTLLTGGTPTAPVFSTDTPLAVGQTLTLTFEAPLPAGLPSNTTLSNTAILAAYPGDPGTPAGDTGVLILPTLLDDDLFSKTSSPTRLSPGDTVTYTFTFKSPIPLNTDLTLTDFLPLASDGYAAITTDQSVVATITQNGTSYTAPNIGTATVPKFAINAPIPAGTTTTLTFTATFNPDNAQSGNLINHAVLHDGSGTYLSASDEPGPFAGALFVPTKSASPTTAAPGQTITYTITATNLGTMAADPFTITELLPLGMRFTDNDTVSATLNGAPASVTATHLSDRQPVFTLSDPVPPGATVVLTFTALTNPTALPDTLLINSATISAFPGDPGTTCWDTGVLIGLAPITPDSITAKCCCKKRIAPCGSLPLAICARTGTAIKTCKNGSFLLQPNTTYEITFKVRLHTAKNPNPLTIGISLDNCPVPGSRITVRPKSCTYATLTGRVTFTTGDKCQRVKLVNYSKVPVTVLQSVLTLTKQ